MNKNTLFLPVLILPLLLFVVLGLHFFYSSSFVHSQDEGPLSVKPGNTSRLKGPWNFFWNEFVDDPDSKSPAKQVGMPYQWNSFLSSRGYPVFGYATYTYTLETAGMRGRNALFIPPVSSACRLYINGSYIDAGGKPGTSVKAEKPWGRPLIAVFDQTDDTLELVLQVSNHSMLTGGFSRGKVEYGREADVRSRYIMFLFIDGFLFFLLFFMSIVALFRFIFNRREIQNVFFSLLCMLFTFRVMLTGMKLIYYVFPFFPIGAVDFLLMFISFLSLPLFLAYFRFSFPGEFSRWSLPVSAAVAVALAAAVSVVDESVYPYIITGYGGLIVLAGLYIVYRLVRAVKKRSRNARIVLTASCILLLCALNDVLYLSGLITSVELMNFGVGIFALTQILILGSASRRTFTELYGVHEKIREMQSLQDIFFTAAAKDLHKPLKGIIDVTDSLLRGSLGPITSDQLGSLSLINASSLQLSNMVSDIIDFRRISDGNITITPRTVILFQLMERVKVAASLPFREKSLEFRNEISRDIELIYADENLLERAFFNLARGFAEYAGNGVFVVSAAGGDAGVDVSITWESEDLDRDGIGHAFSGFDVEGFRDGEEVKSTGLALSIAKRIIEIQGGTFTLVLEEGNPVTMKVTLPESAAETEQESEEEEAHRDALINLEPVFDNVVLTRNIDIMIVSNDLMELQVMKSQLASMNYNVIPVSSGAEALEKIVEKCPNLVLLDVHLRLMGGFEVCSKIREHYSSSELPVILITEKEKVSDLMEGLTSGANDFLARPYHMEEFLTRVNTHIQLARINQMYSRFVPTEFLNTLGQANIIDLKLGDQVQREMTVLFVDIRAFTNLSENMTPQENFKFINSYLSRFSPMITNNNGFVDKFIGDAIMALYPGPPEDAIQTALEMVEHVKVYNSHRANCGYNPINIGIGIHTGNLILGIIGDDQRMQGTVISDAVNLASRIQDVTKLYHTSIVISQETFVKLENPMSYDFRFLGKVKVKGKAKSVSLFEIFNGDLEEMRKLKAETKNDFETAIILFAKRRFEEASVIFEDIVAKNPDDYASRLFLDRAKKFLTAEKRAFLSSL